MTISTTPLKNTVLVSTSDMGASLNASIDASMVDMIKSVLRTLVSYGANVTTQGSQITSFVLKTYKPNYRYSMNIWNKTQYSMLNGLQTRSSVSPKFIRHYLEHLNPVHVTCYVNNISHSLWDFTSKVDEATTIPKLLCETKTQHGINLDI